jgi:hypothetical protein
MRSVGPYHTTLSSVSCPVNYDVLRREAIWCLFGFERFAFTLSCRFSREDD